MRWAHGGRPRRHLRRRLRGEGAFNGIGIPQVFPVLSREVRLRTGEAPPYAPTCLKLDGGLPSMNSPIARTNVLKYSSRRSTSEADQAKTVMVPTPAFTADLIHVVD